MPLRVSIPTHPLTDISHRLRLLLFKAGIWARAGKPAKGFSIALRVASSAHRALILPVLWEAVGALANILLDLSEFDGARQLVDGIMPQVSLVVMIVIVAFLCFMATGLNDWS